MTEWQFGGNSCAAVAMLPHVYDTAVKCLKRSLEKHGEVAVQHEMNPAIPRRAWALAGRVSGTREINTMLARLSRGAV
jgi:hypothetical protein